VNGDCALFGGRQHVGAVTAPEQEPVPGRVEVDALDGDPVGADGVKGGLVDQVGQVGAGKAGVPRASTPSSTSAASVLAALCLAKMSTRSAWVGWPMSTIWSNRPGRSSAGSSTPTRLVAAMTTTPVAAWKPSISASGWLRVCSRSSLCPAPWPRLPPMASISSMKMIDGASLRAWAKRLRTRASTTMLATRSGRRRATRLTIMPPRLCPTSATGGPSAAATASSRVMRRSTMALVQPRLAPMPLRKVRWSWRRRCRGRIVIGTSPAMKPGAGTTGTPRPGGGCGTGRPGRASMLR